MYSDLPAPIRDAIQSGQALLFLGSGASLGALRHGSPANVSGDWIRDKLNEKFLSGRYPKESLRYVAQLARNEAGIKAVQHAVREYLLPLQPAPSHRIIPTFRWFAIITTNYDLVVEEAYRLTPTRLQELVPVVTNQAPRIEDVLSAQNTVPYLKLHGCISRPDDVTTPLVIAPEEYMAFARNRQHLATHFQQWAAEHPIVFCGYSLKDENVAQILFDLGDGADRRPQYAYVTPNIDAIQERFWQSKRIFPISQTFEEFITDLDREVPANARKLAMLYSRSTLPIARHFTTHAQPSRDLVQYLSDELEFVHVGIPTIAADARRFFTGLDNSWAPIVAGLDVRRALADDAIGQFVLADVRSTAPRFHLLKGYAGSGKSVFLKRLAWETTRLTDEIVVVYLGEGKILRHELIVELQSLLGCRLYLIVDDLVEHFDVFAASVSRMMRSKAAISIIAAVRTNEWGASQGTLPRLVSSELELGDLRPNEIDKLLQTLSAHSLLGPLQNYSDSERKLFVRRFSENQLLVALHEITEGKSFEEIIRDEFEKITPREAQQLYLDICTLHQFKVTARAGFIARTSGMRIDRLADFLRTCLSQVVRSYPDSRTRDYVYRSRHDEIAKIVFTHCLSSPTDRTNQITRVLRNLDIGYSSDREGFNQLTRGRMIADQFSSRQLAERIFTAAEEANPPRSYLLHQRAIFEAYHGEGRLNRALQLLAEAEIASDSDIGVSKIPILHTRASVYRRLAVIATNPLEREKYRADARAILKPQLKRGANTYAEHLYGTLLLDEIGEYLSPAVLSLEDDESYSVRSDSLMRVIGELNEILDAGLQSNPDDEHLVTLRTQLFTKLGEQPKAMALLEAYVRRHEDQSFASRALAEAMVRSGDIDAAVVLLRRVTGLAPNDKAASFRLARILLDRNAPDDQEEIGRLLRRSYTEGDSNYDAQFWSGRHLLLKGDIEKAQSIFQQIQTAPIASSVKNAIRGKVKGADGEKVMYQGTISAKYNTYAFVQVPLLPFSVYLKGDEIEPSSWARLARGSPVKFALAFNYRGAQAVDVEA